MSLLGKKGKKEKKPVEVERKTKKRAVHADLDALDAVAEEATKVKSEPVQQVEPEPLPDSPGEIDPNKEYVFTVPVAYRVKGAQIIEALLRQTQ